MLSIDDFKTLTLDDKPLFDKFYKKYPPVHSDYVFTTLISWMEYLKYRFVFIEDNLVLFSQINEKIQFRPPLGKRDKELFDQVLKLAKEQSEANPIIVIDNDTKEWISKNYPKIEIIPDRDYFDYVYQSNDLAELAGSAYSKIRNRLNKFKKNFNYSVEKITGNNIPEVKEFLKRWCLWKDCSSDPILDNERKAIIYSMSKYFELKLSGIAIRINNRIEAIAVFEKMNEDTAVVHYEKGAPEYDGIYKAINQETANILRNDFKFINRESDMNLPGLRQIKMSYRPHHMIEVYNIKKDSIKF